MNNTQQRELNIVDLIQELGKLLRNEKKNKNEIKMIVKAIEEKAQLLMNNFTIYYKNYQNLSVAYNSLKNANEKCTKENKALEHELKNLRNSKKEAEKYSAEAKKLKVERDNYKKLSESDKNLKIKKEELNNIENILGAKYKEFDKKIKEDEIKLNEELKRKREGSDKKIKEEQIRLDEELKRKREEADKKIREADNSLIKINNKLDNLKKKEEDLDKQKRELDTLKRQYEAKYKDQEERSINLKYKPMYNNVREKYDVAGKVVYKSQDEAIKYEYKYNKKTEEFIELCIYIYNKFKHNNELNDLKRHILSKLDSEIERSNGKFETINPEPGSPWNGDEHCIINFDDSYNISNLYIERVIDVGYKLNGKVKKFADVNVTERRN